MLGGDHTCVSLGTFDCHGEHCVGGWFVGVTIWPVVPEAEVPLLTNETLDVVVTVLLKDVPSGGIRDHVHRALTRRDHLLGQQVLKVRRGIFLRPLLTLVLLVILNVKFFFIFAVFIWWGIVNIVLINSIHHDLRIHSLLLIMNTSWLKCVCSILTLFRIIICLFF